MNEKMNNLEWVRSNFDKLEIDNYDLFCVIAFMSKTGKKCEKCGELGCRECQFRNIRDAIDYLLQEHKEPIKLKQWEYDLIKYHTQLAKFNDRHILMSMKNKGHFKDLNSVERCSMTIKEILENCTIVSDDYEGFEECK